MITIIEWRFIGAVIHYRGVAIERGGIHVKAGVGLFNLRTLIPTNDLYLNGFYDERRIWRCKPKPLPVGIVKPFYDLIQRAMLDQQCGIRAFVVDMQLTLGTGIFAFNPLLFHGALTIRLQSRKTHIELPQQTGIKGSFDGFFPQ